MKAMKKSILTFLAFALVFTMAMPAFAANVATGAQYSDVENADVADAVKVLSSLAVLQGYPDGTFKPDNSITRAEFSAVVVRLLGYEKAAQAAVGKTPFKDEVLPWASGYVNIAVQQNLLTGYPDGTFRANQPVTQAEALTILVRALGYKALADKQGQWPYNYIVMADSIGLTDDIDGVVANEPANRGFVALASEAALTIPKAIASGFTINGDINYVVSGTQNTKEQTILANDLKYASKKAIVTEIPRINSKLAKDEIKIVYKDADEKSVTKTVTVPAGFDFEAAFGSETALYLDGSKVVYAKADAAKYDAIKEKDGKITLVDEDAKYEVAKDAKIYLDGKSAEIKDLQGKTVSYAKVVLNKDDDIRFIDAFNLDSYMVVQEAKDKLVTGYKEELDVAKYTIVKDGKTISADNLAEGDILFFNTTAKYAEVYTDVVTGALDNVFTNTFKLDGKSYTIAGKYVDGDKLSALDTDALTAMMDEKQDVKVSFNRLGDVVLVVGDLGKAATSTFYGLVTADTVSTPYNKRNVSYYNLDVLTPAGEVKPYDIKASKITDSEFFTAPAGKAWADIKEGQLVEVTVNDDNEVTKVKLLAPNYKVTTDLKVDAKYAGTYQLQDSAVVFLTEGAKTIDKSKTMTWGEVSDEFSKVEIASVYANDKAKVVALVISKTNADADTDKYTGVVTKSYKFAGKTQWELTLEVAGKANVYVTDGITTTDMANIAKGDVVEFKVGKTSGNVTSIVEKPAEVTDKAIQNFSATARTIKVNNVDYQLVADAVIYDTEDLSIVSNIRDLQDYANATVYTAVAGSIFAQYVFVTEGPNSDDDQASGMVAYKNADGKFVDSVKLYHGEDLELDVVFTNTGDKSISLATAGDAKAALVNATGTNETLTNANLNTAALTILPGKSITFANKVKATGLNIGKYTLLVTVKDGTDTIESTLEVEVVESNDATLSTLTVDSVEVVGFASDKTAYTVKLASTTTTVPNVAATKASSYATAPLVTQAINLDGTLAERTATVKVTAEDGTVKTYTVVFVVNNKDDVQ